MLVHDEKLATGKPLSVTYVACASKMLNKPLGDAIVCTETQASYLSIVDCNPKLMITMHATVVSQRDHSFISDSVVVCVRCIKASVGISDRW